MKGRMFIDGELFSPVYLAADEDVLTIYRTDGDEIDVLYTLLKGSLHPGENNEIFVEGFMRKMGDPEFQRPRDGEEYMFRRLMFYPESSSMYRVRKGGVDFDS
ncbi:MAG: hypothetical protein NXI24_06525 [bacterium]|nr:hypothetical protein [bacterium]